MRTAIWWLLGLCMGVAIGLLIGWGIAPVEYYDTLPAHMRSDYQDEYVLLVALNYRSDGRLNLAQTRLQLLNPDDPTEPLLTFTEQMMERRAAVEIITILADLARALQVETPAMRAYILGGAP